MQMLFSLLIKAAVILCLISNGCAESTMVKCESALSNHSYMLQGKIHLISKIPKKPNPDLFAAELDGFLGLSFMATSSDSAVAHWVFIETDESAELSRKEGEKLAFRAKFYVGPRETLITRAFSEFELIKVRSGERVEGVVLNPQSSDFKISNLSFSTNAELTISRDKVEMLPIYSCQDLLNTRVGSMNLASFLFFRGSKSVGEYDSEYIETISRILDNGLKNLLDPKIQKDAVEAVQMGTEVLEKKLNEIGLKFGETVYGHIPQKAWAHTMGRKQSGLYPIMVEGGNFAISHGAYAHHAQLLAFFGGMPAQDRKIFLESLMEKQRSSNPSDWYSWVTLFDSDNTRSPNTAFFWHEKILEAQEKQ